MYRYWLYGKHPVISAIKNVKRKKHQLLMTSQASKFLIANDIEYNNLQIAYNIVDRVKIDSVIGVDQNHQGIALEVSSMDYITLDQYLINIANDIVSNVIILDQINDPHNIGAIVRSAAAFGIKDIICTTRNSFSENAIIAKTAAGCLEYINILRVCNLVDAIKLLKKHNFWVIGLDGKAINNLKTINKFNRKCIVFGSEGKGIRRLTKEHCDILVKIEIDNKVDSINVSNAVAVVLYQIAHQDN